MKLLNVTFYLLFSMTVNAQIYYSTDWIRPSDSYQKTGAMGVRDNSDNYAVTGFLTANNIFTRKYDKFGNLLWERVSTSGVASNYEKSVWINSDSSNNIIVTGYRYSIGNFHYPNALVILKYDPAGNLLWKETIGMTFFVNHLIAFNMRSEVDLDGNIYIGTVAVTPSGFVLLKLDPSGNILFTNSNNQNGVTSFISMRLKGNQIVMSGSSSNLSAAIAVSWDKLGNVLWTGSFLGQSAKDVEIDNTGNSFLLTSYSNQVSASSGQDIMIYKIDSTGAQLWVNSYDFGGMDFPTRFILVEDRISVIGYGSIGASYFDWITFQVNTGGLQLWNARYNETSVNDEQSYFICAKANGDVFVTGRGGPNYSIIGTPYLRMITLKYDHTGTRKWVDSVNVFSGRGVACTLATDSSLYVLSDAAMTAFHFLNHTGNTPATIPPDLQVFNVESSSASFSWTPVAGAYLYHLRYKLTSDNTWTVASINLPTITITGLIAGVSYDFACEAINSGGPSGYSATQSFVTSLVLPITNLNFTARRNGSAVDLDWLTASEQNSAFFILEKSENGINYQPVGQVQAAGNSNSTLSYHYTDFNVSRSISFYRLKIVDLNAVYRYSPVRAVSPAADSKTSLLVYPNPTKIQTTLVLWEVAKVDLLLTIFNYAGQQVKSQIILQGEQVIPVSLKNLPKGIYSLQLRGQGLTKTSRIVVY